MRNEKQAQEMDVCHGTLITDPSYPCPRFSVRDTQKEQQEETSLCSDTVWGSPIYVCRRSSTRTREIIDSGTTTGSDRTCLHFHGLFKDLLQAPAQVGEAPSPSHK